ncbi:unnamed protein product [Phaeothamnion confervicola]
MSARPVVKASTMPPEMQEAAIQAGGHLLFVAQDALRDNNIEQAVASSIKSAFETMYPSVWHCFVGRNFGCFVTHEHTKFCYFYVGQMGVCLFATA